jgi:hypothetical protein
MHAATNRFVGEAFGRAHAKLLTDLRQLEKAVLSESGQGLMHLHARLARTYNDVAAHFRFEEQDGYMAAVRKREPRLERAIQELAGEHAQLSESLNVLMVKARVATTLDDELRQQLRAWVERVREHEARENQLVQGAFNLDIAGED